MSKEVELRTTIPEEVSKFIDLLCETSGYRREDWLAAVVAQELEAAVDDPHLHWSKKYLTATYHLNDFFRNVESIANDLPPEN